jgi:hypothetical protein
MFKQKQLHHCNGAGTAEITERRQADLKTPYVLHINVESNNFMG